MTLQQVICWLKKELNLTQSLNDSDVLYNCSLVTHDHLSKYNVAMLLS